MYLHSIAIICPCLLVVICLMLIPREGHATVPGNTENSEAVKEVLSGKRIIANAAWWGFDEFDATEALQSAINSGAKRVIVPNMTRDWIVRPINLAGDQVIAEINMLYEPDLIVLDGMRAFVDSGPEAGKTVNPGVIIAGTDRVAVDAVGVGILRSMGTTPVVSAGKVFDQEQIKRAAELRIGVDSPSRIQILVPDGESAGFAQKLIPIIGGISVQSTAVDPSGKLNTNWGKVKDI